MKKLVSLILILIISISSFCQMNSEGLSGVLIQWLKPYNQRNYDSLVENVDYIILNYNKICPVTDGRAIDFTGAPNSENLEWLMRSEGPRLQGYDYRLYLENSITRPTNQKDSIFIHYDKWLTSYSLVKRSNDDICKVIEQLENDANNQVQNESEKAKMLMISPSINAKISAGISLNTYEQAVYTRMLEVADKAWKNAANAKLLKDQVNQGITPNLDSGWETDSLTPTGYPFNQ